jgi:hypothetical protein
MQLNNERTIFCGFLPAGRQAAATVPRRIALLGISRVTRKKLNCALKGLNPATR